MTEIEIEDRELGETVGAVSDDGTYRAATSLAEDVLVLLTDGPAEWRATTPADEASVDGAYEVEPGDPGYLRALAEMLPSPLTARGVGELPVPDPEVDPFETDDKAARQTVEDTPFSIDALEEMAASDGPLERKSDDTGDYFMDLRSKEKVYIESPTDAPEGANVQTGPAEGTFYDSDDVEAFDEAMASISGRVREQYDFTDEQWSEAEALEDEYRERSDELFEDIVEASGMPGDIKATHRVKSAPSMLEKAYRRDDASAESVGDLEDVFGAKFVPSDIDEVRETADNLASDLSEHLDLASVEVDDRLDPDDDTHYRAVHIDFETEDGLAGEIQVKSEEMEQIIDIGHDTVYKNNAGLDDGVLPEVDDCLTAQMDALFGEPADPDDACTDAAREAFQAVVS